MLENKIQCCSDIRQIAKKIYICYKKNKDKLLAFLRTFIIIVFLSGIGSFIIDTYLFPKIEKHNNNTAIYWTQKIYLTNEINNQILKLSDDNTVANLKSYFPQNKKVHTTDAFKLIESYSPYV